MAVVQLSSGDKLTVGGTTEVYGTTGTQTVTILDQSNITFRSGFNNGATDTIILTGLAKDFDISIVNGNAVLTSLVDGISINLPVGANGTNITFEGGDTRLLAVSGGTYSLGSQTIVPNAAPVDVTPGPGTYTVTADAVQHLEGTVYAFTVTRSDTSVANEQLTFNVQGDTHGGTVAAALPGLDFTAAGNTVTFSGNNASATFYVNLNLDNNVEGLEGILAQVFKDGNVVGSALGLIEDANKVGQTFILTSGIDKVGSGTQQDIIGSEGSTSTVGQDTIVVTENTATNFDYINGGDENDTLNILDAGSLLTVAPNFSNITVLNVENATYTSVRGLNGGKLDTSKWAGLETFVGQVDSNANQTFVFSTEMDSISLTNAGNGDVAVQGGSGVLTVNATAAGDVRVGQDGSANAFTDVFVNGGDDVDVTDTSADQTLKNVQLSGFAGTIAQGEIVTLTGDNIETVGITGLTSGGARRVVINAIDPTVTVTNVSATLDIVASNAGQFIIGNGVTGLRDVTALDGASNSLTYIGNTNLVFDDFNVDDNSTGGAITTATITNNSSNGSSLKFDDINGDSPVNDTRTVTLNATGGSITLDDIFTSTLTTTTPTQLNITGSHSVFFDTISPQPGVGGIIITRTGSGDTTIGDITASFGPYRSALGTLTQFNGSGDTGSDTMTFAAGNTKANTFGGGDDNIALLGSLGVGGSLDAGVGGHDRLFMEANNLASFTKSTTATSNFEELVITHQVKGTDDVINLQNIGFEGTKTDVISGVGPGTATPEVTKITISGEATWTDTVKFSGQFAGLGPIVLSDKDDAATIANKIATAIDGSPLYHATASGGVITVTAENGGPITDISSTDITFEDTTTPGAPSLEAGSPSYNILVGGDNTGAVAVTGVKEIQTLVLEDVTLDAGETITFTWDPDGPGGLAARTFTYTNTTTNPQTQNGGFLADAIVKAANTAQAGSTSWEDLWVATRVGNNVQFEAKGASSLLPFVNIDQYGDRDMITISGSLAGGDKYHMEESTKGVTAVAADFEEFTIFFDAKTTGNDKVTFDGITVEFADGLTPAQMAAQFIADYGTNPNRNWDVSPWVGGGVHFTATVAEPRTDVTAADFVFEDDTNVGTPSAAVLVETQGTNGSITLNGFKAGSTLTLTGQSDLVDGSGLGGTHIVNLAAGTDTSNDTFHLVLDAAGNHGTVRASLFETVTIDTRDNSLGGTDTLVLNDTAAKSITVTGNDGLTLDTDSTVISNLDASALGSDAFFTWTADANTVAITIKTGAGGSNVDVSAIHLPNATPGVSANPIQFIGGSGADEIHLGTTLGSARANITLGEGHDLVHVGFQDGGNDYSNINDFNPNSLTSSDKLDFDGLVGIGDTDVAGFFGKDEVLEATASFQDYLDQASNGAGGSIHYFWWTDGNTYVVKDNNGLIEEFVDGVDQVIRLTGHIDLTAANFA